MVSVQKTSLKILSAAEKHREMSEVLAQKIDGVKLNLDMIKMLLEQLYLDPNTATEEPTDHI